MLYPTIQDLTKNQFNRYELVIATAKCARLVTDEYIRQKEAAEKTIASVKETDKSVVNMIDKEYRDEKAVKVAINHIHSGDFIISHVDESESAASADEDEAVAAE